MSNPSTHGFTKKSQGMLFHYSFLIKLKCREISDVSAIGKLDSEFDLVIGWSTTKLIDKII